MEIEPKLIYKSDDINASIYELKTFFTRDEWDEFSYKKIYEEVLIYKTILNPYDIKYWSTKKEAVEYLDTMIKAYSVYDDILRKTTLV